ncbi:MAG: dipeptide ABC transporter ATP-binding protein [Granulosicoccus sp.]
MPVLQSQTSKQADLILDVQNLHVHFAHESGSLHAVRGLNFTLHTGESLAVVGESGSGKSATAMAIMGLLPDSARVEGSISLRGQQLLGCDDATLSGLRGKSIAMVFQDPLSALTPVYTVGQQIAESILVHSDWSLEKAMQRAIELLDLVGIAEPRNRAHAYPHEFSGGMRQRVMIAMAIASNPDVIIADEPTTALDVTIQAQVLDVLQNTCRELGAALLMITHDLGVVARVADRAIVLYSGKAVEQAEVSSLFATARMPYTMGLLGSLPVPSESSKQPLSMIDGYPPSPLSLPQGCSFAPRCPLAESQCESSEPELMPTDLQNHYSACVRHQKIAQEELKHADLFAAQQTDPEPSLAIGREAQSVILQLSEVKQHYPLFKGAFIRRRLGTVYAVDGIDLELRARETLALVGESGCGKSTTAHAILDLQAPTHGSIRLFGEDVRTLRKKADRLEARRKLQVVFQDPMSSLDPRMPVFDLVAEPLRVFNMTAAQISERIRELLSLVGLETSYAERYPQQLSGGQCQRVCIARALAVQPTLLVLDEPVSALDVSIRAGVINLLDDLKVRLGLSYLFIAHDLALVRHFADRVAVMYLGKIIETGTVDDVYANPQHPYTRCLLSVVPIPDPVRERSRVREMPLGELPSPTSPPGGCRFHTRCPRKPILTHEQQNRCVNETPSLTPVSIEQFSSLLRQSSVHCCACHYADEASLYNSDS